VRLNGGAVTRRAVLKGGGIWGNLRGLKGLVEWGGGGVNGAGTDRVTARGMDGSVIEPVLEEFIDGRGGGVNRRSHDGHRMARLEDDKFGNAACATWKVELRRDTTEGLAGLIQASADPTHRLGPDDAQIGRSDGGRWIRMGGS